MVEYVLVVSLLTATAWAVFANWDIWGWGGGWERTSGEGQAHLTEILEVDDVDAAPADVAENPVSPPPPTTPPPPPPPPPPYVPPFSVGAGGTITLTASAAPEIKILGSAITYGAGGPQVPVSLMVNVNGTQTQLFKGTGSQISSSTVSDLGNFSAGTGINFSGKSYHPTSGNTLYTQSTTTSSPMVIALKNGDMVPDKTPFGQQPAIKSFLTDVINPTTQQVTIGENQVLYLMELGTTNTSSPAADFQDLVFLVSF